MGNYQSGLTTKKDRPTRKLRKERKNRAKKVSPIPVIFSQGRVVDGTPLYSSVVPRSPRLPSRQRRADRGWSFHLAFLLHLALLVVCTQHYHAVCTIACASCLREFISTHGGREASGPDIMRGYIIYTIAGRTGGQHLKTKLFMDHIWIFLVFFC